MAVSRTHEATYRCGIAEGVVLIFAVTRTPDAIQRSSLAFTRCYCLIAIAFPQPHLTRLQRPPPHLFHLHHLTLLSSLAHATLSFALDLLESVFGISSPNV